MASSFWIASACSAALILPACHRKEPLPVLGSVPHFSLTSQAGVPFNSDTLSGKVWVADFIFTNCTGPCPRMTSQMHKVQLAFPSAPDLKLVSISIDPNRDTPQVLAGYAAKFHADHSQWTFLTGPVSVIHNLSRNVFMLSDVDGKTFEHSTRFMLVDRKGQIRGAYLTSESDSIPKLMADIKTLLEEPS
jgi:protein SCO1/2